METPDTSWLHDIYEMGEIDTRLPLVAVDKYENIESDYFWQGEEAQRIIEEIHKIWTSGEMTTAQAFQKWIDINLC